MEKETKRGNGIQEAKSSILFISTRILKEGLRRTTDPLFVFNLQGLMLPFGKKFGESIAAGRFRKKIKTSNGVFGRKCGAERDSP